MEATQPSKLPPASRPVIAHWRLGVWRIGWWLSWPIRTYLALSSFPRGKRLLRRILAALLPPLPTTFTVRLDARCTIEIGYREEIGLELMTNGTFEPAELDFLRSAAEPGTVVMDVGANVGITTIPLATALAANGRVIACEPSPANAQRLRGNIERNGLTNVDVFETAISNRDGRTVLYLANDPAYHSIEEIPPKRTTGRFIEVPVSRLDTIWQTGGRPKVSLIKIDVEGAELDVLKGAERLIDNYAPRLVVETNNEDRREAISRWLGIKGYSLVTPIGFMPWNNVFSTKDSTN